MTSIDIALNDELQEALKQPVCLDIGLPKPGSVSVTLPSGGKIKGIADITKGIPTDCSLTFSLMLQLAPFMANLECFIKLLKLIEPLIEVIKGLPFPPVEAIKKFAEAVPPVVECITALTFAGIPLFIKDILCLIIKLLKCMIGQLKSLLALLGGLQLQITAASEEGNEELLKSLECAQENAMCSGAAAMQAFEPITVILELAGPLLEIAGVPPIEIPALASAEDLETFEQIVTTLEEFVQTLELAAEVVGGCD